MPKLTLRKVFSCKKDRQPIDPTTVLQGNMHVTESVIERMLDVYGMNGKIDGEVSYTDLQAGQTVTFLFNVQEEDETTPHLERVTVCLDVVERGSADYVEAVKDIASKEELARWIPPNDSPTNWLFECTVAKATIELEDGRGFGSILPHGGVDVIWLDPLAEGKLRVFGVLATIYPPANRQSRYGPGSANAIFADPGRVFAERRAVKPLKY